MIKHGQSPQHWLEDDSTDPGYQLMTDAEFASEVLEEGCDSEISDNETNDDLQKEISMTPSQAFKAFGMALEWHWNGLSHKLIQILSTYLLRNGRTQQHKNMVNCKSRQNVHPILHSHD